MGKTPPLPGKFYAFGANKIVYQVLCLCYSIENMTSIYFVGLNVTF